MMTPLDQIIQDLDWRESELASLKILLGRKDITQSQREVLLRAAWAMLYAHYEGFVKTALSIFYDEARKRITNCGELPQRTRASALKSELNKIRSMPIEEFLDTIENFATSHHSLRPDFPEVDTQSNLWPNILDDLLKAADLNQDVVEKQQYRLKTLVARRNEIAHGKQNMIADISYYNDFEAAVYDLMYDLALRIDERLSEPPYALCDQ